MKRQSYDNCSGGFDGGAGKCLKFCAFPFSWDLLFGLLPGTHAGILAQDYSQTQRSGCLKLLPYSLPSRIPPGTKTPSDSFYLFFSGGLSNGQVFELNTGCVLGRR
jgi:hypothetical protein